MGDEPGSGRRPSTVRAPLTPTQRDVFLDQQLHPELPVYSIGCSVNLGRELEPDLWHDAVQTVFASEPIMHTRLEETDAGVFQYVDDEATIHLGFDEDVPADPDALRHWIGERLRQSRDQRAPFQHWLVRTSDGNFYSALGGPHVLSDGHSYRLFFERVARCYAELAEGRAPTEPAPPSFYTYLRESMPTADDIETVEWWKRRFAGVGPLSFRTRQEVPGEYRDQRLLLDATDSAAIAAFCSAHDTSPATFFLALSGVVLQRYREPTGDWSIHAIRGTRPSRFHDAMGCFFRVLPYRLPEALLQRSAKVADLLRYLRDYRREVGPSGEISMLGLQQCLPPAGCRTVYNFYDFDRVDLLGHARTLEIYFSHPPNEMHLIVGSSDGSIELRHFFHTSQFNDGTVLERMRRLARQVVDGADRIADLDWLLDGERTPTTDVGVGTAPAIDATERSVDELFEEQAARRPDAVAVVVGSSRWSYAELNDHANRLARLLVAEGIGPGDLVGLYLARSFDQVAAILAVLKAGAAYVPIDPEYPETRVRLILDNSRVALLITHGLTSDVPEGASSGTLHLDDALHRLDTQDGSNLRARATPDDLAYVIYTSGSTGEPKGVMVTRHNVSRLFSATQDLFAFDSSDVWPLLHSYAFDFSVWEMWGALAHGGRLVVVPTSVARSPEDLHALLEREGITVFNQTPSAFYRFMESEQTTGSTKPDTLRWIVFGGEALDVTRLRPWFDRYGEARPSLVNMYGITETTVHATWRLLQHADAAPGRPCVIGRPLPDLQIHLTDDEGQVVPRGVAGEVRVSGEGVALGYLHNDELTRARFIDDRIARDRGGRCYRSGDLARELQGGDLEYLGRIDHQIQIRGYRVELGEIEAVLRQHPGVADAAIEAQPDSDGNLSLTAYIVRGASDVVGEPVLRELLEDRLPDYMRCARYVFLPNLPLTVHGKVDRAALPQPLNDRPDLAERYAPARTQTEELLVGIFSEVTGVDRVGIHDDFFALGGNSLSATQVVASVRELFERKVPLRIIFEAPTVAGFAEAIERSRFDEEDDAPPRVVRVEDGEDAPLTFAQERVWLIQQLDPGSVAYQFEAALRFRGELRVDLLEHCLHELVDRHEVLRTTFPAVDGRPVQRVHPIGIVALETISLDHLDRDEAEEAVERWRRETADQTLDLDRLPLVRWTLFRISAVEHVLLHREHHLLHDGWSFVVLVGDLLRLYQALADGRPSPLPALPVRLGDFARAEREWILGTAADRQRTYWRHQLAGAPQSLELPTDLVRPLRSTNRGDSIRLELPADLVRDLRALAREQGVTLFTVMLSVFGVVLARYSGATDLCIGSGVANRQQPDLTGILGMMLNNVILRLDLHPEQSLASLLQEVQGVVLGAVTNQDLPFDRVVQLVRSGAESVGAPPVCPVFFSSYEGPIPQVSIPGLTVDVDAGLPNGSAKFDLNVIVAAQPRDGFAPPEGALSSAERVTLIWEYSTDLFERASMEQMAGDYLGLLRSGVGDPLRPWHDLEFGQDRDPPTRPLAPEASPSFPRDASIADLWEEQVARSPDVTAVRDAEGAWTFRELDAISNQIARLLLDRGVQPDELVGCCLPRGRVAVAAMLGILKAGAAYLPLDPNQPERRVAWLATDADLRFVVMHASSRRLVQSCATLEPLCLDELDAELARLPATIPPRTSTAESLAYVMFTSGSTGPPKGVEVLHRGVVRLVVDVEYVDLGAEQRILQLAPLTFDASTFEIWAALLRGGSLVVYPEDVPDVGSLGRAIADEGITTMWLNASLFNTIVDQEATVLAPLEQLLIGGEALSVEHVRRAYRHLPRTQIINGYGPTENTTFSCTFAIPRDLPPSSPSVPLGSPIAHSTVHVLDERMRPVPRGVIGELYLGGDGVARGYRAQPELTAQRFLPDPFSSMPGARLYRSGDFGRVRSDGTLEFRGRLDDQVKIRGFRIEPAEIEWALHRLSGVQRGAVVARRDPRSAEQLVAYVVPTPGIVLDPDALRDELRLDLPAHLVPHDIVVIDALPLSPNGKVDRASLPAPGPRTSTRTPVAPRNAREEIVAGVMAEVLGVEEVGVDDQFFDLGGHSLLGLELLARLSHVFEVDIPVPALVEHPTVAGLAAVIEQQDQHEGSDPGARTGSLVRVKPGGSKPPLYFTPGGDGGDGALLVYARVARSLGVEQPFYGFRARGVDDGTVPHRSVEDMAADYLAEVKQLQPRGPYYFGGECVGGVIAYEMARQALAAGDDVGLLVLLDSRPPRVTAYGRHWARFLSSRTRRLADKTLGPVIPSNDSQRALGRARLRRWLETRLPYDAKEAPPTIELAWVKYQRTLLRYRPRPYQGRMALILSDQYAGKHVDRSWEDLVPGGIDVQRAVGDHDSYVRQHAKLTADILEACLDRASETTPDAARQR
jgi:amino acid adenylation domain-containing protein